MVPSTVRDSEDEDCPQVNDNMTRSQYLRFHISTLGEWHIAWKNQSGCLLLKVVEVWGHRRNPVKGLWKPLRKFKKKMTNLGCISIYNVKNSEQDKFC